MIFARPSWQMSMSISGISLRLGSMNRSNSRPYLIGSTLHSPSRYPTIVPTPEPLAPHGNAVSSGEIAEIPHDQEIRAEILAGDDFQFVFQALANFRRNLPRPVAPFQPVFAELTKISRVSWPSSDVHPAPSSLLFGHVIDRRVPLARNPASGRTWPRCGRVFSIA